MSLINIIRLDRRTQASDKIISLAPTATVGLLQKKASQTTPQHMEGILGRVSQN